MRNRPAVDPTQPAFDDSRQRESRVGRRPRAENAAERTALRKPGRGPGVSGSVGVALGRHAHSRHNKTAGRGDVCRRKAVPACHCRSSRSVTTNTANASCIWTAALKSKRPITACRRAGSESSSTCNGIRFTSAFSIRKPTNFCASMSGNSEAGIASMPEDNPKKTPFTTAQLLARAARAGSHIGTFCEAIHRHQGESGIRRILGVLSLAKKFGAACRRGCLRRRTRTARLRIPLRPPLIWSAGHNCTLRQVDPLIRELTHYRDLINTKIQEQNHESD